MTTTKTEFGLENKLENGLRRQVDNVEPIHPIEMSERNFAKNQEKAWAEQLRKLQGMTGIRGGSCNPSYWESGI
jgi:hypothetical protein